MTLAVPHPAFQSGQPYPDAAARKLRTRDFDRLYQEAARRERSPRLQALARRNRLGRTRWGISVKGRLGNAVLRNRVKRRLREILRRLPLPAGWDVVVQPRTPEVATAEFAELTRELERLLGKTLRDRGRG